MGEQAQPTCCHSSATVTHPHCTGNGMNSLTQSLLGSATKQGMPRHSRADGPAGAAVLLGDGGAREEAGGHWQPHHLLLIW